eukprot:TRINITY_DN41751_c0_g1_i1.p2 TRINITY_DN41751_c0_g1~~TRINITY_DN41751_c0_g1_i1.p2  ORF type:complete len:170 (+),score=32.63 TRINITY_DN41751_c0_g1_i1:148-657(+)
MFDIEKKAGEKQELLSIQSEENKIQNMIEGNRINQLAICDYSAQTDFFFQPETSESYQKPNSVYENQVQYLNTRIEDFNQPLFDVPIIAQKVAAGQKDNALKNYLEEYDLIPPPSPYPEQFKSPLITWGEIEDTPLRIDKTQFRIQNKTLREKAQDQIQHKFILSLIHI